MLRWLKDRKKQKKGQKVEETPDEYGFHDDQKEDEKMYHIYEEIPDLPRFVAPSSEQDDQSPSFRETSFSDSDPSFDHVSVFSADTLRKYIIGSQGRSSDQAGSKRDGPYMVVPLLNSGEEEKPPLPPPNEKKVAFTCALVGRRHSSVSRSTESGVEVSYDSSESQGSEANFSSEQVVKVDVHNEPANRMSCRAHARQGSLDTSDTGCEYDMGTSSESDHNNYEYYLTKIEQNLAHKLKTREIIQQSVPEEDESDNESLTTVSSVSCCSSVRAGVRVPSGHRSTDVDSDEGTLADHSESENSSGYYESFNGAKDISVPVLKSCLKNSSQEQKHYIKNKKRTVTKKCKHKCPEVHVCIPGLNSDKSCKHRSTDALNLNTDKSAFQKVNRPVYKSLSNGQLTSESGINRLYGMSSTSTSTMSTTKVNTTNTSTTDNTNINLDLYEPVEGSSLYGAKGLTSFDSEGREVYSPPPTIRDFSPRTTTLAKCSLPRAKGCTNVYRSKGSQNRLLSDLIIMNYDRQLFIH